MSPKTRYVKLFDDQDIDVNMLNAISIKTDSICFDDRSETWSAIDVVTGITGDELTQSLAIFALFENDYWGDETDYILAYFDWYSGDITWKEIDGTYDDIITALIENEIVEG